MINVYIEIYVKMKNFYLVLEKIKSLWVVKIFSGTIGFFVADFMKTDLLKIFSTLAILTIIDFVLGTASAIKNKKFEIKSFTKIIYKLIVYFLIISATFFSSLISPNLNFVMDLILLFLSSNELISILKNVKRIGVNIPNWIIKKIEPNNRSINI